MKSDDSSLEIQDLIAVEARAKLLLDRAEAWGRFPTPVEDILAAANLRVAPKSMFDPVNILAYIKQKGEAAVTTLKTFKSALSKVFGIYDANEQIIHIDDKVKSAKQTFLKLHETGHHELPAHRKLFSVFQDCELTLAPEIADLFERQANNFARYALFQGNGFQVRAADSAMSIKTPMSLAKDFGASIYASCREFARTHHRSCVVYALEPMEGFGAKVRRIEPSPSFLAQFGRPSDTYIDFNHALGTLLPVNLQRMVKPTHLVFRDKNGVDHECLGESFKTPFNILLLIYPIKALTATSIIVPVSYQSIRQS